MKQVRNGLFGNFIQLDRAVGAIGARLTLTTAEIDSYRSPNCSKADDDVETLAERADIGHMLRRARAAGQLLQVLNRVAEDRPKWYDVAQGFALLDESVSKEGTAFLVQWMKQALPPVPRPFGKWSSTAPQLIPRSDPLFPVEVPRSAQVGFDIDELIRALDVAQVPHTLGAPANTPTTSAPAENFRDEGSSLMTRADAIDEPPHFPPLIFRDPLSEELECSLKNATDPWNPSSVFAELRLLALQSDKAKRRSLVGMKGDDVEYEYKGKKRLFSKKDMAGRYRQLDPKWQVFVVKESMPAELLVKRRRQAGKSA